MRHQTIMKKQRKEASGNSETTVNLNRKSLKKAVTLNNLLPMGERPDSTMLGDKGLGDASSSAQSTYRGQMKVEERMVAN
jgi:hypothetical protein